MAAKILDDNPELTLEQDPERHSLPTNPAARSRSVVRGEGVTVSERYLKQLGDRAFLPLWSYAGIYRDQGRVDSRGHGKEVCDLLVVFDDHIIIFSDKDCEFPDSGNLQVDWDRWYRKAITKSAEQIFGAERWIREHPDRLFLDRECTEPFPLALPAASDAKIHRIVVAHGVTERCRREVGGSGSLKISFDEDAPFVVGHVDLQRGFVHILDDRSLDIVLRELDTISDFVAYLSTKEHLIQEGRLASAAGEEDLLAHYLFPIEGKVENDFVLPTDVERLAVPEGLWNEFDSDPYRLARNAANAISYFWDRLIEEPSEHVIANTQYYSNHPGIQGGAEALRIPARERRTRRRLLSIAVRDFVMDSPMLPNFRAVRVMQPTSPGDPYYAFLQLSPDLHGLSEAEYREFRRIFLEGLCEVVKLRFPDADDIVGIATELGRNAGLTQDVVYLNARDFSEAARKSAEAFADAHGLLTNVKRSYGTEYDYPHPDHTESGAPFQADLPRMTGRNRNQLCPCGSGKKFKKCCGPLLERFRASRNRAA